MKKELLIQIFEKYLDETFQLADFEEWLKDKENLTLNEVFNN